MTYPHTAGWKDATTSREAAQKIEQGRAPNLRDYIASIFSKGHEMTADEVAELLEENILTIRPRVSELYKQGLIERTGERRPSANGQSSHVYRRTRPA